MKTQDKAKSFAFKLASDAKQKTDKPQSWRVRDGVAVAGCTGFDARAGRYPGRDNGIYC